MLSLLLPPGRFSVGATTFQSPVAKIRVGSSLRSQDPALELTEVAFTAFYPTCSRKGPAMDWLTRPLKHALTGLARFAGYPRWMLWPIIYLYGSLIKIPVHRNAPLQHADDGQWPVVIFSHGLGGSRTAYSQLCSRIAATGKIVLAIEHRDGTGSTCVTSFPTGKVIYYLKEQDVTWPDDGTDPPSFRLRVEQLEFRLHEIYSVFSTFRRLVENDETLKIQTIDDVQIDWSSWTQPNSVSAKPPARCTEDVGLVGHSFGGCTVFSLVSSDPPSEHYPPIPISSCLALDPWLEPIPSPGPVPLLISTSAFNSQAGSRRPSLATGALFDVTPNDDGPHPRLLIVNSEQWTLWTSHFERLKEVTSSWRPQGRIITLVGSMHASFSDFPLLPFVRSKASQKLMDVLSHLSVGFLDDELSETLEHLDSRTMEVEIVGTRKDGRPKRKLAGEAGHIIIH
ncbi:platelet-activating factor acetylhydrolase, isoform II-domain-containing protein [Mycena floridula]|nr:platelet-activating factor acetylhydrolase, isoform II-domain-containing protein [Mycena floridula]